MKKEILYQLSLVIAVIILGLFYYHKVYDPSIWDYTFDPNSLRRNEIRDGYAVYQSSTNRMKGTKDLLYVPCPSGYICKEIPPISLKEQYGDIIVTDSCSGKECLENLGVFLRYHDVYNVSDYMQDKKTAVDH